ncbi:hypothetical protein [Pedobacter sp.]
MQITVTLDHTDVNAPDILAFLQTLTNSTGVALKAVAPKTETPKKETAVKAIPLQKAVDEVTATETPKEEKKATTASKVSIEQLRAAVQLKAQAGKRTELKELLTEFGTENVTSLEKDKYVDFLERVNAL